jgi:hypothetical protein
LRTVVCSSSISSTDCNSAGSAQWQQLHCYRKRAQTASPAVAAAGIGTARINLNLRLSLYLLSGVSHVAALMDAPWQLRYRLLLAYCAIHALKLQVHVSVGLCGGCRHDAFVCRSASTPATLLTGERLSRRSTRLILLLLLCLWSCLLVL